ncbi:hypothetical protein KL86DES1_22265 [uncultured Desulfovibrio sp.]|uniref:Uncharacterized protein n=1 Tax=uncultured Desulfovibrio sp. TaxID=167968 RepID=A0A212LBU7_9BACT|nr:hypothetical protein KL86DES1_22265 [uncultured Desulfovibrio sp.]VZH35159.1 conserved protein of unknown function [Desulfovibrio sp. 86]
MPQAAALPAAAEQAAEREAAFPDGLAGYFNRLPQIFQPLRSPRQGLSCIRKGLALHS